MRKRSVKSKDYDENIIASLKSLPVPLKTFDGHDVVFEKDKRSETIIQHISKQKHKLKKSDVEAIPKILRDRNSLQKDNKKSIFRNYVGGRPKKNAKLKYIKIVTKKIKDNIESVITIYLIKIKNVEKRIKR